MSERDAFGHIFAFDAGDLDEIFELELRIGGFIDVEARDTLEPILKLKAIARETGYRIIRGHDPQHWPDHDEGLAREM